ncbi:hypothetical protein BpHYR1_043413 [Brachionus plicatilis]|uniref:Uncharacterized protein n=1 Tax=Brachionus plicatilis TaxID=10195 RepID=A0A3M7SNN7_BRAPC|nr:hypothetical protein BpHYR1_043413 [Brachionus plicatilis]
MYSKLRELNGRIKHRRIWLKINHKSRKSNRDFFKKSRNFTHFFPIFINHYFFLWINEITSYH